MARRTAGRLGEGGGPGIGVRIFPPPHPAVCGEVEVLQVSTGDAAHQRMSVQAGPGPPFEVPETEFLLQLLMRLLAHPTALDGGRRRRQRRVGRQVTQIVLALAA